MCSIPIMAIYMSMYIKGRQYMINTAATVPPATKGKCHNTLLSKIEKHNH